MQSVAIPTSAASAVYRPAITASSVEVWSGMAVAHGGVAASANATASIASPITVSLTQNGTGPDTGAVVSWFAKVTR